MGSEGYLPLFETRRAKVTLIFRVVAATIFLPICMVWIYRATQMPWKEGEHWMIRWGWIAMFGAEIWFSFYWVLSQTLRWNVIYRATFKDKLFKRYDQDEFPRLDIFVCTADPILEPPIMVINTVLSVMAYDYQPGKLAVYLSDDGGSQLTFYAMLEASQFAKYWLPYCRKYNVEPRSPDAYFSSAPKLVDAAQAKDLASVKKLYEEMENRIEMSTKLGRISEEIRAKHKGFSQWDSYASRSDHDTILQILIDGRNKEAKDLEGCPLPTLVYLAREKRPQYFHNYKAGALNALIRVSSKISNGQMILNLDCDMYSNNSQSVYDALCVFMDEKQAQQIAFVQFPQKFANVTKNDLYSGSMVVHMQLEFHGLDGFGGPVYIGTGCFHRRDTLCGRKFSKDCGLDWMGQNDRKFEGSLQELEEEAKALASCTYELNSQWGKECGLKYGFIVEDSITGLGIKGRGWKSVFLNPKRPAFLGALPITLAHILVQQKRWGEGLLQIVFSKHCPLLYEHKTVKLGLRLGYSFYFLWALNCLPTLCYSTIPSLFLLRGIPLFPQISSPRFLPFAYIIITKYTVSLAEYLCCQGTVLGWWNEQRMWLYKRTSSYTFAFINTFLTILGLSDKKFVVTTKAIDEEVSKRYEKEMMEFGVSSPMFTLLATLALLNLFCFVAVINKMILGGVKIVIMEAMGLQILLCGVLVLINLPLYEALFMRKDRGKMPIDVTIKSIAFALLGCACFCYY
ncbi:glycosyltransferase 2 [Ancistrocladus abbreviatus]